MEKGAPNRKIGIVTFNHEVAVIGDGTKQPQIIAGDKLNDMAFLRQNGENTAASQLGKTVKETKKELQ